MSPQPIDVNILFSIVFTMLVGFAVCLVGYIVSVVITPRKHYRMKKERFEAGNPPKGKARGWFMMQYFAYLIVFLTLEPILIYLFLLLMEIHTLFQETSILFMILILMLIPPLIFGLDSARRVKLWLVKD